MADPSPIRILVVEDHLVSREVLAKALARDGYDVRSATTAREAIETGMTFRPHLLLTDWLLPDSPSGLYVAETLRSVQPDMPVVFLTGLPTEALIRQARHVPSCMFVEKPCDFTDLLRCIRGLVRKPDGPVE